MAKVSEKRPKTFSDFVSLVEKLRLQKDSPLWFRGCGRADYKLLPTLYRHNTPKNLNVLARLESQLIVRFRQRSIPFHNRSLDDDWDTLFFMQHYGVPTRLLDWTENPFIGLYFAIMSCPFKVTLHNQIKFNSNSVVWILDSVSWNRYSLSHQSYDSGILTPGDDALKGYKPTPSFSGMYNHPVALYGAHNSSRIVAQRGVFTIFGQNTRPMEDIYEKEGFPDNCLIKVILDKINLSKIRKSILSHGITESVVFPDLEGLAREIRRSFGFEF